MGSTNRSRRRLPWTPLRVGTITVAMGVGVAAGVAVGLAALAVDTEWLWPPPVVLGNVEGARVVLGAVVGGLITVAVFGLWMRTVVVGVMASHFSPRTLLSFLDDRFQRNLLAFMSAGVVTVLVILLRMPHDPQVAAPFVSTVLAVMLAIAALSGVLLAIQQATRTLSLPELISRLADDALEVLARQPETRVELAEVPSPASAARPVPAPGTGWVTSIDVDRMREALPVGGVVHLRCRIGEFVTFRRPVALLSLVDNDEEADVDAVSDAISVARTRSPDIDLAFAVSQLVDVGVFALQARSDTGTAHEVLSHLELILEEIVDRGLPRLHDQDADGRRVYDETGWNTVDLLQLCVERLREPVTRDPETTRHLMHMLRRIHNVAEERGASTVISEVARQVESVLTLADRAGILPPDRERLQREAGAIVRRG